MVLILFASGFQKSKGHLVDVSVVRLKGSCGGSVNSLFELRARDYSPTSESVLGSCQKINENPNSDFQKSTAMPRPIDTIKSGLAWAKNAT